VSRLRLAPAEPEKALRLLELSPARIAAATAGVPPAALSQPPGGKAWSPAEVLAHLRACDDLWSHSIYAMLAEDRPVLPQIHPRRWARAAGFVTLDFRASLRAFRLKRAELVGVLRPLPAEAWRRSADIGGRAHTVYSQVRRLALHEQEHCNQLEQMLGKGG
jgi:DinB superfamily